MKKKIYEVLYGYALECKSRKQLAEKREKRYKRSFEKKYELTNRLQNLQKKR